MAKINYSKVEEALAAGLIKMNINELDKLGAISQKIGRPELRKLAEAAISDAIQKGLERKAAMFVLKQGSRKNTIDEFYEEFDLSYDLFCDLLDKGKEITEEEWTKLLLIKDKMLLTKEKMLKTHPELQDDKVVEQNRKEQINARIHIKKTWIPLQ